ncbi:MAG: AI-2E family transporter [Geminicoccaceae bacterium]|nr:AI-2E family transporter [Geminicoccaceae bacterium]
MAQLLEQDETTNVRPPVPAVEPGADRPASGGFRIAERSVLTLAAFVIIVAGLNAAAPLVVSFLLAGFIAVILAPPFLAMQRRGVPSGIALLLLLVLVVGFGLGVGNLVDRSLENASANLQSYGPALEAQARTVIDWLAGYGLVLVEGDLRGYLDPSVVLRWFGPIAGTLGDLLVYAFIILIVAVFILLEAAAMPAKVRALPGMSRRGWTRLQRVVLDVRHYMLLKTVMSLLTGLLVALWVAFLGIDFPILLGCLAFALNYVPNIGSIAAALPAILLAFIQLGLGGAAVTAIGYVVINVGISNGLEPRFMGPRLGLSPLIVLTSVIFWGWVLGPLGMLLSVPLTMTIKIALESDESSRWIALLLSSKPPRRPRPPMPLPRRLRGEEDASGGGRGSES